MAAFCFRSIKLALGFAESRYREAWKSRANAVTRPCRLRTASALRADCPSWFTLRIRPTARLRRTDGRKPCATQAWWIGSRRCVPRCCLPYRRDCSPADFLPWDSSACSGWLLRLHGRLPSMSRGQAPAWITIGAGARIGLVTGLLAAWLAFTVSGSVLFVERFVLHQSGQIDSEWKSRVETSQQMTQQWAAELEPSDAAEAQISAIAGAGMDALAVGTRGYRGLQPHIQFRIPALLCGGRRRTGRAPACPLATARSLRSFRPSCLSKSRPEPCCERGSLRFHFSTTCREQPSLVSSGERESMSEEPNQPSLRIKGRLMSASEIERTLGSPCTPDC